MRNDAILLLVHVVYAVLVSAAIFGLCVLVKSLCRKFLRKWENKNFLNDS
ncbi:hypothetical protein JCM13369A_29400 [Mediterraneibacter glycyrrhizinilyticus JCM 13369]